MYTKIGISIIFLLGSFIAEAKAEKVFTPEQLMESYQKKSFPREGKVKDTNKQQIEFGACQQVINQLTSPLRGRYPVRVEEDSPQEYTIKVWVNDGTIVMECLSSGEMVTTQRIYR
ncbi:MAG: hypothetical protein ACR2N8_02815 [Parvibaculales bacterium]